MVLAFGNTDHDGYGLVWQRAVVSIQGSQSCHLRKRSAPHGDVLLNRLWFRLRTLFRLLRNTTKAPLPPRDRGAGANQRNQFPSLVPRQAATAAAAPVLPGELKSLAGDHQDGPAVPVGGTGQEAAEVSRARPGSAWRSARSRCGSCPFQLAEAAGGVIDGRSVRRQRQDTTSRRSFARVSRTGAGLPPSGGAGPGRVAV